MSIDCTYCATSLYENSVFCHNCGKRVKCSSCNANLVKDANFCISCGAGVESNEKSSLNNKNTVEYHRKTETNGSIDEISCKVELNDAVGKEGVSSLINGLVNNTNNGSNILPNATGNGSKINDESPENNGVTSEMDEAPQSEDKQSKEKQTNQTEYPHLNDIEINLTCSEAEWILIYAFYESNFAAQFFTRQAVYERYMHRRRTPERVKNFSKYWKSLFKKYISTVNATEFKFKSENLDHVKDLILGKIKSKSRGTAKTISKNKSDIIGDESSPSAKVSRRQGTTYSKSYSLVNTLNLNPKDKKSLKEFFAEYNSKNNSEYILVVVYYVEKILNEKGINENIIYTCLKYLAIPIPNITSSLNNIKARNGWINTTDFSNLSVSVAGENHLEHEMSKNAK